MKRHLFSASFVAISVLLGIGCAHQRHAGDEAERRGPASAHDRDKSDAHDRDEASAHDKAAQRDPASDADDFFLNRPVPSDRHVLMMHLDGFNSQAFEKMLAAGQLPHFRFLVEHGKLSTHASTVDKSETMKVIPAYLSSKVDTRITAWWQFDRSRMGYSNFWIDPVEIVNYALGLDFPLYPTILDVMARDKQPMASGFSLFRRGVKFDDYSRIYMEGFDAVYSFRYYNQADASMSELVKLIHKKARAGKAPRLMTALLAAADEMTHLNGLTTREPATDSWKKHCIYRQPEGSKIPTQDAFDIVERELRTKRGTVFVRRTYQDGKIREGGEWGHFYDMRFRSGRLAELCFNIPSVSTATSETETKAHYLYPEVALAYLMVDIELGRLMNGLRDVRLGDKAQVTDTARGLEAYLDRGRLENSLFEKTLFLLYGDHGMVNTFKEMNPPIGIEAEKVNRDPASLDMPFAQVLAEKLGLAVWVKDKKIGTGDQLVVDYQNLPPRLKEPAADLSWQTPEIQKMTKEAQVWADDFFAGATKALKDSAYAKYWWLFFLRGAIIDPKVEKSTAAIQGMVIPQLVHLYLEGMPAYVRAEREANLRYYEKNIPLVYGGGALNNAELFLPVQREGRAIWGPRPDYSEILDYRHGELMRTLKGLPGIGLIFIRKQNAEFETDGALPRKLEIVVMDRKGGEGLITVTVDPQSKERIYHYRVAEGKSDPLMYGKLGQGQGTYGTYAQWNQWSVENHHFYHNAVAGMGSYLYSSSPAIGDISMMHEVGWNFGENLGGHGGLESGEKLTVMLAAGPGVRPGELKASATHAADQQGQVAYRPYTTSPTNLDVAPTALAWLGYPVEKGEGELTRFSRNGFPAYLRAWTDYQKKVCARDGTKLISLLAESQGIGFQGDFKAALRLRLKRLCHFLDQDPPKLPDYNASKEDGHVLELD